MSTDSRYTEFLRRVQPLAVALNKCTATVDRVALWNVRESRRGKREGLVNTLNANYRVGHIGSDFFDVIGELSLTAGDEGKPALAIEFTFEAHFHGINEDERDLAQKFAQVEARLFLWPYFRELTSSLTAKMGIPTLVLPLVLRQVEGQTATVSATGAVKKGRRTKHAVKIQSQRHD